MCLRCPGRSKTGPGRKVLYPTIWGLFSNLTPYRAGAIGSSRANVLRIHILITYSFQLYPAYRAKIYCGIFKLRSLGPVPQWFFKRFDPGLHRNGIPISKYAFERSVILEKYSAKSEIWSKSPLSSSSIPCACSPWSKVETLAEWIHARSTAPFSSSVVKMRRGSENVFLVFIVRVFYPLNAQLTRNVARITVLDIVHFLRFNFLILRYRII